MAVGSGTVLVDDPLLTVREVYRERPLTRVVFDRRLRVPPDARLFSTLAPGPVIVLTSMRRGAGEAAQRIEALRAAGATVLGAERDDCRRGLELPAGSLGVQSLVLEGGAALHARGVGRGRGGRGAALRGAGRGSAPAACRCSTGAASRPTALVERRVDLLGPDVLIEGYVHRPH